MADARRNPFGFHSFGGRGPVPGGSGVPVGIRIVNGRATLVSGAPVGAGHDPAMAEHQLRAQAAMLNMMRSFGMPGMPMGMPMGMGMGMGMGGQPDIDAIAARLFEEAGPPPSRGVTTAGVAAIPEITFTDENLKDSGGDVQQCAVCQDDFAVGDKACKLACAHCFHRDCISPWLKDHNTCPTCRKEIADPGAAAAEEADEFDEDDDEEFLDEDEEDYPDVLGEALRSGRAYGHPHGRAGPFHGGAAMGQRMQHAMSEEEDLRRAIEASLRDAGPAPPGAPAAAGAEANPALASLISDLSSLGMESLKQAYGAHGLGAPPRTATVNTLATAVARHILELGPQTEAASPSSSSSASSASSASAAAQGLSSSASLFAAAARASRAPQAAPSAAHMAVEWPLPPPETAPAASASASAATASESEGLSVPSVLAAHALPRHVPTAEAMAGRQRSSASGDPYVTIALTFPDGSVERVRYPRACSLIDVAALAVQKRAGLFKTHPEHSLPLLGLRLPSRRSGAGTLLGNWSRRLDAVTRTGSARMTVVPLSVAEFDAVGVLG